MQGLSSVVGGARKPPSETTDSWCMVDDETPPQHLRHTQTLLWATVVAAVADCSGGRPTAGRVVHPGTRQSSELGVWGPHSDSVRDAR